MFDSHDRHGFQIRAVVPVQQPGIQPADQRQHVLDRIRRQPGLQQFIAPWCARIPEESFNGWITPAMFL